MRGDGLSAVNLGADYTDEEREFLQALDQYKRLHQKPRPTWAEVLGCALELGYRQPEGQRGGEPVSVQFAKAMDVYEQENSRPFPTWREVLKVLHELGYSTTAPYRTSH